MKLNEFITQDFINSIPYIAETENNMKEYIYIWILSKGYSKEVSSYVDLVNKGYITKDALANIINLSYLEKWKNLKEITQANISLTGTEDVTKEVIKNDIYGFNGNSANDYELTKTTTQNKEYADIFENLKKNLDFREVFSYYSIIVSDILNFLTIKIY